MGRRQMRSVEQGGLSIELGQEWPQMRVALEVAPRGGTQNGRRISRRWASLGPRRTFEFDTVFFYYFLLLFFFIFYFLFLFFIFYFLAFILQTPVACFGGITFADTGVITTSL